MTECKVYYLQEDGSWWVDRVMERVNLCDMPLKVQEKLSVLLHCPDGFDDVAIGRRLSREVYWVYM